jgi:hypothetical protein
MALLVPAGTSLRTQINERWPTRSKAADGWIGDAAHAARTSDHNPDAQGWVHALDVDHHLNGDPGDDERLLDQLRDYIRAGNDHGVVSYIVHDDRLAQASTHWAWAPNTTLEHHAHIHISFTAAAEHHGEKFDLPILAGPLWDGHVPADGAIFNAADDPTLHNPAAWRVACRLYDLGYWDGPPPVFGAQGYPRRAVAAWQEANGWDVQPPGAWGPKAGRLLFG